MVISWITQLCALCAMSALAEIILPQGNGREGIRILCGLMMLHLTCKCAEKLLNQLVSSADLMQMYSFLMN